MDYFLVTLSRGGTSSLSQIFQQVLTKNEINQLTQFGGATIVSIVKIEQERSPWTSTFYL